MVQNIEDVPKGKRGLILEAAERVFSEKGFYQAKVEEIAVEAGVGKGTVYEYFASKEEVFQQMVWKVLQDSDLNGLFPEANTTTKETIASFLSQYYKFVAKHRNLAKMLIHEQLSMNNEMLEAMKARKERMHQALEEIVVMGISTGELRADIDPNLTAHLIMGATLSLGGDILKGGNSMSAEELSAWVIDKIFKGIGSHCNS